MKTIMDIKNKIQLLLEIFKEMEDMVTVYATLIIYGRRTFEQVPDKLKDAVREELASMGLDEEGQPIE